MDTDIPYFLLFKSNFYLEILGCLSYLSTQVFIIVKNRKNIAIIAAWGKDSLITAIQLCKRYEIPFFVIHDWDLNDPEIDISKPPNSQNGIYQSLSSEEKAQYTKNYNIQKEAGVERVHHNKKNLEDVLDIKDKGAISIFTKLHGKAFEQVLEEFPHFMNRKILDFLEN